MHGVASNTKHPLRRPCTLLTQPKFKHLPLLVSSISSLVVDFGDGGVSSKNKHKHMGESVFYFRFSQLITLNCWNEWCKEPLWLFASQSLAWFSQLGYPVLADHASEAWERTSWRLYAFVSYLPCKKRRIQRESRRRIWCFEANSSAQRRTKALFHVRIAVTRTFE